VLELLNWTAAYFKRRGIRDPRLNAEVLLGKVLGMERIMLYARFEQTVPESKRAEFRELVVRRAAREPLQYVLGTCEFYGRDFEVGPAVMVPRQETELLVEKCLDRLPDDVPDLWAADVGTGSGVIACTLAAERPSVRLVATDADPQALAVAERNARRLGVADRIRFLQGDLATPLAGALLPGRTGFELIASNPPYVPTAHIQELEPEVRDFEPRAALDGGPDGLEVIRRLVRQVPPLLAPGGWLAIEIGEGQAEGVEPLVRAERLLDAGTLEFARDGAGRERVACVRRKAEKGGEDE